MRTPGAVLLLLLLVSPAVSAQEPYIFDGQPASEPLGNFLSILPPEQRPANAAEAAACDGFLPFMGQVPNLGLHPFPRWVRFTIQNRSKLDRLVISVPYPEIDRLTAYLLGPSGPHVVGRTGQAVPISETIAMGSDMAFILNLNPGAKAILLLEVESTKQMQLPIIVSEPQSYLTSKSIKHLFIGGYFGIMMVMAIYNLFIYLSIRDRSYLYYVLYIICLCFAQFTLQGAGQELIWPDAKWFAGKASVLFTLSSMFFAGLFVKSFIGTRSLLPRFDMVLNLFLGAILTCILLATFGASLAAYHMAQALSGTYPLILIALAVSGIRKGSRPAGFFLFAWSFFLIGVIAYILRDVGILPYNQLTAYAMPVGSVLEGVLLSFGLADRINVLRQEKEASQAQALRISRENERIIREQNVMLESKVQERTQALQESNEHLKHTQTQLVNAEKMASLGQLTAGIAHEINNPVNFITSNLMPLRRNIGDILEVIKAYREAGKNAPDPELKEVLRKEEQIGLQDSIDEMEDIIGSIEEGANRTAEIVRGLRNFSRLDEDDLKDADLNEGIRSTLTVLGPQVRDQVEFDLDLQEIPSVECFPGKLNQVVMNILSNAAQAVVGRHGPRGGLVAVATMRSGNEVYIKIKDNGPGMTDEVKARIFDPFFTTKPVGEGTGLGLSIAYSIVEKHHGRIEIESQVGVGTEFRIVLPISQPRVIGQRA